MRRKDREITEIDEIIQIVGKAKILHLGLFDGEYPYIVPLHFGYEYRNNTLILYMHGAKEGHKLDLIQKNPHVCIELECDIELVSGGDDPCKYSSVYASVIGRGRATLVTEEQEKIHGLTLLMMNQTGRAFEIDGKMASSVEIISVIVSDFTAKARSRSK